MRLWTLHPRYLDAKGLVAVWREALLAQKVLQGGTRGYTRHPQLARFRAHRRPLAAVGAFLTGIAEEAQRRGYNFDAGKISHPNSRSVIRETRGQLRYEWEHLKSKLRQRAPQTCRHLSGLSRPDAHPMFILTPGPVRRWEKRR